MNKFTFIGKLGCQVLCIFEAVDHSMQMVVVIPDHYILLSCRKETLYFLIT